MQPLDSSGPENYSWTSSWATLSVTGSDVITLTVHHRAGDPGAGGTNLD